MAKLSCVEVEDQLAALALGALSAAEKAEVVAHLDGCPGCRNLYQEYLGTVSALGQSVPRRIPPIALQANLLARIQSGSLPAGAKAIDWLRSAVALPRWRFVAAILAVLIMVAVGIIRFRQLSAAQANLESQLNQYHSVVAMLADSQAQSVGMIGTEAAKGSSATLLYNPQQTTAVLLVHSLPALSASQSYQLWMIDSTGKRDSGAVFTIKAGATGGSVYLVSVPRPLKDYVRCGVSIEPSGGSPRPTGPAVLTGKYS